jgi:hypothetical protein
MGCSCVLNYFENDFDVERIKEIMNRIKTNPKLLKFIIYFQSLFRGYIFRKKFYNLTNLPNGFSFSDKTLKFKNPFLKLITYEEYINLKNLYPPLSDNIQTIFLPNVEYQNKSEFLGEWNIETGKRHGRGIQKWLDGSKYEGYFTNDKANIQGKLTHPNSDVYEGEWVDDKAQGFGIYTHVDGSRYEGYWKDDKQSGRGIETWPDKTTYEGNFSNGMKNGYGKFIWKNGSCYEGEFKDNYIEGKGTYIWDDNRKYVGSWKKNEMDGYGVFSWPDGRRYEGEYKNDKKEGYGTFYWTNGRIYKGEWKNGKQHGIGEVFNNDSNKWRKAYWEEGKKIKWIDSTEDSIAL